METQRPRQLRLHRGLQGETPRAKGVGTEIPPAHFRVESATTAAISFPRPETLEVETAQGDQSTAVLSFLKSALYFSQTLRTAFPLFLVDSLGFAASMALSEAGAALSGMAGAEASTSLLAMFARGLIFVVMYTLLGLYPGVGLNPIHELKRLAIGNLSVGVLLVLQCLSQGACTAGQLFSITLLTAIAVCLAPLMRILSRSVCSRYAWWGQPAVIIGSQESAYRLMKLLSARPASGLRPLGMIDDAARPHSVASPRAGFIGTLADVRRLADQHNIFWAIIAPDPSHSGETARLLRDSLPIPNVVMIPEIDGFPSLWSDHREFNGVMGIHHREHLLNAWSNLLKRIFDISGVVLGTLVLSPLLIPLFLLAWASVKMYSPGPVFYGQDRVGKDGRPFRAWKFRTMVVDADEALAHYLRNHPEMQPEWDSKQKLRNDPRIIPGISSFLRLTSLDELPQLWNVLIGEMSLVGPRPFMLDQLELYGEPFALYRQVRPGMTGLWQISGRNHMTFQQRAELDVYYIRNWSWWLDLFILGRTVKTVILREGAF